MKRFSGLLIAVGLIGLVGPFFNIILLWTNTVASSRIWGAILLAAGLGMRFFPVKAGEQSAPKGPEANPQP